MSLTKISFLVVAAGGGLGKAVVREALSRGNKVAVLVRNAAKYRADLEAADVLPQLSGIYEGSGESEKDVTAAIQAVGKVDVVVGTLGGNAAFSRACASASKAAGAKFLFVAGATNVVEEDGVTPSWIAWQERWPPAANAFKIHGAAIAAIREVAPTFVVFCPPYMAPKGAVSSPPPTIRINRPGMSFVSYEDAAWVMLEAASTSTYDGQLITAAAPAAAKAEL